MFRPLSLYIGLRYTRAKRRNHFISFISLTSMIGIALGVTVLITVLSVMNGFDEEIRQRIFSMATQIAITSVNGVPIEDSPALRAVALQQRHVLAIAPLVLGQGMIIYQGQSHPILLSGVLPDPERKVSEIPDKIVEGRFALPPSQYKIVLGEELATALDVTVGDRVNIVTPQATLTLAGIMPRFKTFIISGIFRVGRSFGFESSMAYISLQDAKTLFQIGTQDITGLRLKLDDLFAAPKISLDLARRLPPEYQVTDWTSTYGSLMYAVALEKRMMFFILLLLIAISAFNLVSSLMMVVTDKRADIAILRTLGATPRTILAVFMVQGCIIGLLGTLIGLIAGLLLAHYAGNLVSLLEHVFHIELLTSKAYFFINRLPSKIEISDVIHICSTAMGMSLLATIYPALKAARTAPAEALRYE